MSASTRSRAAFALVLVPACLVAQPLPQDDVVVVTASRLEQRLRDAIPHTTVLTEKDIRDSQAVDLTSLLRSEAGFESAQNGGIGAVTGIFMRGGRSAQALILVDGARVEDVSFGQSAIQHILLDEVERIEIVRGNVSSLYGSGAIGGVVQVFTKRGQGLLGPYGELTLGARETSKLRAGYGGQAGDTRFNVTATRFDTRGFSAIDPRLGPLANPDPDGYRNESFAGSVSHRLSSQHEFGASFLNSRGKLDYDGTTAFFGDTPATVHQSDQELGMLQAYWETRPVQAWNSRLTAAQGTEYRTDYRDGAFSDRANTRSRQLIWDNELRIAPQHAISAGVEQLRQVLDSSALSGRFREVEAFRLGYLGRLGAHSLQANARREDYSDFGEADTHFLGYGFDLTDAWRLTASTATAFRAPSFEDLFNPFGGNPLLRPERARTNELGAQWSSGAHRLRVVAFGTEYQDAITFSNPPTFIAGNVRRARVDGVESSYSGNLLGFELRAALTIQDPIEQEPGEQELQAVRRAKKFGSIAAFRNIGSWRLGAVLLGSGSRPDSDVVTFARLQEAGYAVLNLTARYEVTKALFVAARLENALDEEYRLASGYNTAPRGAFLTVGWQP
jgi:vitamin B12 transporter